MMKNYRKSDKELQIECDTGGELSRPTEREQSIEWCRKQRVAGWLEEQIQENMRMYEFGEPEIAADTPAAT